jgi:hypothetical protein
MGILRAEQHVRLFELAAPEANMSDEPVEEEIDEMEPDPDLIDEEMGEEEIEIDLEGDDLADDDDDDENQEIPAGARPTSDDDEDDEDDDDVEADLDTILKERLSSAEEDEEEEEEDEGVITTAEGDRIPSKQEDEILCEGCFLLVKESQYDMMDGVAICPHCGTPLQV